MYKTMAEEEDCEGDEESLHRAVWKHMENQESLQLEQKGDPDNPEAQELKEIVEIQSESRPEPRQPDGLPSWDSQRFRFQRVMMPAPSGGGQIEMHMDRMTGQTVAVKRLPHHWVKDSPQAFREANRYALENPWLEMAVSARFSRPGPEYIPGVCSFQGAFRSAAGEALLVSEFLPDGDLFEIANRFGPPGPQRERQAWCMVRSLLGTVRALHSHDVAHGDISLENIMMRRRLAGHAKRQVQGEVVLVDFGATVVGNLSEATGIRGKASYQAPEMHSQQTYDARACDLFACGVVAYSLAVGSYPWNSTRPGECIAFEYAQKYGLEAFLQKRKVALGPDSVKVPVASMLSQEYQRMMLRLLDFDPDRRVMIEPLVLATVMQAAVPHVRGSGRRPKEKTYNHRQNHQVVMYER
jgi:serine/threonine protein kinase